jgi:6-phosphogluconolactonase (cycloisomerase 2 family)
MPNGYKLIGYQSTLGKHPRTFAIDETGKFIIVTNVITKRCCFQKKFRNRTFLKKVGKPLKIKKCFM